MKDTEEEDRKEDWLEMYCWQVAHVRVPSDLIDFWQRKHDTIFSFLLGLTSE